MFKTIARRTRRAATLAFLAASALPAFAAEAPVTTSGPAFAVRNDDETAYSIPVSTLDDGQWQRFAEGKAQFRQRWVAPINIGGNWGRGPTFNGEMCADCHAGNGRGRPLSSEYEPPQSMIVRLSLPGEDEHGGPRPHPAYGTQLQMQGELGYVPAEGEVSLTWEERAVSFADGEAMGLRAPRLRFRKLAFGPLGPDTLVSARVAPPVFGLGLLEAVPEQALLQIVQRQSGQGFNGRPNRVWDVEKHRLSLGRFGWKANQPTLRQQNATAFLEDMGVTTRVYMAENCPPPQKACGNRPGIGKPEQTDRPFDALNFYLLALAVPARRNADDPQVVRGERLFGEARCAACHLPELQTGPHESLPQLSNQVIRPYTDLMLHDMGDELADGRPDYAAGPRDWRTPPLWGMGLSASVNGNSSLLHDGRARNAAEAILWHGGEAAVSREAFRRMPKAQRDALLAFLNSL